jgi:hypothetical protein
MEGKVRMIRGTKVKCLYIVRGIFFAINLILLIIIPFSSCVGERIAPIKVHNDTEETLTVFIDGVRIGEVASGEEIKNDMVWITTRFVIEARNSQGHTIYKEKITLDDMEKIDWKVIISPQMEKMNGDNVTMSSDNITGN